MNKDPYKEYLINQEPSKEEKEFAWKTAIGLQKVDGLNVSEYLKEVAKKNINGEITIYEANHLIDMYYEEKQTPIDDTLEADKVSSRITALLSNNSFTFSVDEYLNINKFLFFDIYKHAGEIRKYDITKKEWVLNNKSVIYGSYSSVLKEIEYDINEEKKYDYANLNTEHVIKHLSRFVSNLWQAHAFGEGNTRTTAVFLIKYLRKMGYNVNSDVFENNAWYFRNSLVRANYADYDKGIKETTYYLELFLRNLLLKENNELKNRYLHIDYVDTRIGTQKTGH